MTATPPVAPATGIGTFAEFIAVREDNSAAKPKQLTMAEAASVRWSA